MLISKREIVKLANGEKHEFGCLMIELPEKLSKRLISWGKENINDKRRRKIA